MNNFLYSRGYKLLRNEQLIEINIVLSSFGCFSLASRWQLHASELNRDSWAMLTLLSVLLVDWE